MSVLTHRLPNGFRIVMERMEGIRSASIGLWIKAGCRHETAAQNGIAHFLEHMAFKGTTNRSARQIAESLENVGGYTNAYTGREMTAYFARVLREDVPLAFDVVSDIVLNPVFDPREIEVERGVILQEIGMALDTPDMIVFDWLQEAAYPDQPMGRSILGPADHIRAFERDAFCDFVGAHYGPAEMILAVAGDFDPDEILRLAEARFADLAPKPQQQMQAARFKETLRREEKPLEQAHVALGFEAPGYRDPAYFAARVHGLLIGGGMASRLFQEARENRGLCYEIMAQSSGYEDTGLLTVYAGTGAEQLTELMDVTIDELKRAAEDIDEGEVARSKAQLRAGLLMGLESPTQRCERMASLMAIWDRVPDVSETLAQIDAVDLKATRSYAEAVLSRSPAVVFVGPVSGAPGAEEISARLSA